MLKIKELLTKILVQLGLATSLFQTIEYSYTYNISAGGRTNITGTNFGVSTPSGYAPIGLAYYTTGSQYVFPLTINSTVTGSSQVMALKNTNTSAVSGATANIQILYMRTDFRA